MVKDVDRESVDIMSLSQEERVEIVKRQFPRQCRNNAAFEVVLWEDRPWIGAGMRLYEWRGQPSGYFVIDRENCWSTPLSDTRRRYACKWVSRATVPQDFIAMIALMV